LREGEFTALQPREARVIKVGGTAGATENDVEKLTLGIPAPMTAEQAALWAGARRRGVQKKLFH
jgi:hypothetical protein